MSECARLRYQNLIFFLYMSFPLFELFLELREPLRLSPEDYHLLLSALELGFGQPQTANSQDSLKQLCRLLWLKTQDEVTVRYFEGVFQQHCTAATTTAGSTTPNDSTAAPTATGSTTPNDSTVAPTATGSTTPDDSTSASPPPPPPTVPRPPQPPTPRRGPRTLSAFRGGDLPPPETSDEGYRLQPRDSPVQPRLTRRSWRKVRRLLRRGTTGQVDIAATLSQLATQGRCLSPPLEAKRVNILELLLLIDVEGSMVPFRFPRDCLLATIEPKHFERVEQYYFRNVPERFVYCSPKGADIRPFDNLFASLSPSRSVALIFSDGGAARGGYNSDRVTLTHDFLHQIHPHLHALVWVNPMPEDRWQGTTAEAIARDLQDLGSAMFELSQAGVSQALAQLRNHRLMTLTTNNPH